jgi:hypothetical protein
MPSQERISGFRFWLQWQTHRPGALGQFARRVKRERFLPPHIRKLHLYLEFYHDRPEWRRAAKIAHACYRKHLRKQRQAAIRKAVGM